MKNTYVCMYAQFMFAQFYKHVENEQYSMQENNTNKQLFRFQ